MKRYLVAAGCCVALLVAFAPAPTFAQSAQSQWKEYSYPSDGFSISAPSKPVFYKNMQNTAAGATEVHNYDIVMGNSGVWICSSQLVVAKGDSPAKLLQRAKIGMINGVNAKLVSGSEKEITVAGYPGLQFDAQNDSFLFRTRFYFVRGALLQIMAVASKSGSIPASADRIFDSLKILPAAASK